MAVRSKIKLIWTEGIKFNDDNLVSLILFASLWGFFRHRLHETASEVNAFRAERSQNEKESEKKLHIWYDVKGDIRTDFENIPKRTFLRLKKKIEERRLFWRPCPSTANWLTGVT